VGVDSGGTFTDICMFEEDEGRVEVWKVSSTPDDPSRGIAQGVEEGMRRVAPESGDRPAASVSEIGDFAAHASTMAGTCSLVNVLAQARSWERPGYVRADSSKTRFAWRTSSKNALARRERGSACDQSM